MMPTCSTTPARATSLDPFARVSARRASCFSASPALLNPLETTLARREVPKSGAAEEEMRSISLTKYLASALAVAWLACCANTAEAALPATKNVAELVFKAVCMLKLTMPACSMRWSSVPKRSLHSVNMASTSSSLKGVLSWLCGFGGSTILSTYALKATWFESKRARVR